MVSTNRLDTKARAQVIRCLAEGNSIRSTVRITGVAKNTIIKLLLDVAEVCREFQDATIRNLTCKRIEADEIWSFCGAKEKNAKPEKKNQGWGDVWTWTAIDADSKLVVSWLVGDRTSACATKFMKDVAGRVKNRIQLTTDGFKPYFWAVDDAFAGEIDYAVLVKIYGKLPGNDQETRYSPAQCIGMKMDIVNGDPDLSLASTSYVERQNLTMRMSMRRFTRLTNGFSKKVANHAAAVSLYFFHYNFCRVHQTLRVTPAMEAGIADHVMDHEELIAMMDALAPKAATRGPYKKKAANSN